MAWVGLMGAAPPAEELFHNDPIATYDRREVHGFTVLVSRRLLNRPAEAEVSWRELDDQLGRVAAVMPAGPLARLRKVWIWLEHDETPGLGEFHWGMDDLVRMRRNPLKYHAIEITNSRHLIEWAPVQPWAALHELAHSYHFLVLGHAHPGLLRAYDLAVRSGRYDRVRYAKGGTEVAYARKNHAEYFAELTEAYFGRNDFEPMTRAELERFDPEGYRLMVEVWGEPTAPPPDGGPVAMPDPR